MGSSCSTPQDTGDVIKPENGNIAQVRENKNDREEIINFRKPNEINIQGKKSKPRGDRVESRRSLKPSFQSTEPQFNHQNTEPQFNNRNTSPQFNQINVNAKQSKTDKAGPKKNDGDKISITKQDQEKFTNTIREQVTNELEDRLGRDPKRHNRIIVAKKFKIVPYDENCKEKYYDATWEVVNNNFHQVKHAFDDSDYFLVRVMNGSIDGPGYGFNTRTYDERNIAARLIYKPKGVHYEKKEKKSKSKDKKKKSKDKKKKKKPGYYEEEHKYKGCEGAHATVKTTWEPFMTQKYHRTSTDMPYHQGNVQSPCTGIQPSYYSTPYINPSFVAPSQSMVNLNMPCNNVAPIHVQPGFNTMYQSMPMTGTKPMFFNTPTTHVPMQSSCYGSFF